MKRGVVMFAYNSGEIDYQTMAAWSARRIQRHLSLPTTLITDTEPHDLSAFESVIITTPEVGGTRHFSDIGHNVTWYNGNRMDVYKLSPYDETILLDTDYMVNSTKILDIFNYYDDFCCHDTTSFLMQPGAAQEVLSVYSYKTLWATVVAFKKTNRAKQIFECLEMVQKNFDHYSNLHGFVAGTYRNDYALTLALNIVNGHSKNKQDIIPWNLVHVGKNTQLHKNNEDEFDTEFTVMYDNWQRGKIRKEYITLKNFDFHVMNKENFLEIIT
jgi:hypothetical protein